MANERLRADAATMTEAPRGVLGTETNELHRAAATLVTTVTESLLQDQAVVQRYQRRQTGRTADFTA
ncbi:hypothetical protein [Nocardia pseudobrasiliensis]|uniref:Uncharacterized protein n=1 Tax=Nocardia pseudobrasiliensis TaxID=45979 RepID=A0A370IBH9_9NOCA|nr:hypothetical protein [Nocardia pseudobrasiliensis]RDI68078.1 hypothetical protein DFR76_102479 [Nocardia pseudobrasiliensis]